MTKAEHNPLNSSGNRKFDMHIRPADDKKNLIGFTKSPLVVSMVGNSGAGKTTLIEKLLRELSKRKRKVAAVKHCPHGFDLDVEEKDSWRFKQAGAKGIFVTSPDQIGLIEETEQPPTLKSIARYYFPDFDIVLGEGFSEEKEVAKIVILRKGVSEHIQSPQSDVLAVVSDFEIKTDKPVFKPDDVSRIADFIELIVQEDRMENSITLLVNKKPVPLNPFTQKVLKNIILGVVDSLHKEDEKLEQIEVKIKV